jgi:hypothetical protein
MPKALCIAGIVVAVLLLLMFGLDLAIQLPFGRPNPISEGFLLVSAIIVGVLGWLTLREQK